MKYRVICRDRVVGPLATLLFLAAAAPVGQVRAEGAGAAGDALLSVSVDVPGLFQEIEKRSPKARQDPKFIGIKANVERLKISKLDLFLLVGEAKPVQPVLIAQDAEGLLFKELTENPLLALYFERLSDTTLKPKWDSIPKSGDLPEAQRDVVIKSMGGRLLVSSPDVLKQLEEQQWNPADAAVSKLAGKVVAPKSLVTVSVAVPEQFGLDWLKKLKENEAVKKGGMGPQFIVGIAEKLLDEVQDTLSTTRGIAVSFALEGENGRTLSYAQRFATPDSAAKVLGVLSQPEAKGKDVEGMLAGVLEVLHAEQLERQATRQEDVVKLDLKWQAEADQVVGKLLGKATVGYIFQQSMASSMKPSEGPIETQYTTKPDLQKEVDADALKAGLEAQLPKLLFPGRYSASGDEPWILIEFDPIKIPNAALSNAHYEILSVTTKDGKEVLRPVDKKKQVNLIPLESQHSSHIRVPIVKGTEGKDLGTVKIQFKVTVPTSLAIFRFKSGEEKGTKRQEGEYSATLGILEKDAAGVSVKGPKDAQIRLYATDETGQALQRNQGMSSGGSASAKFRGIIHELSAVVPLKTEEVLSAAEVDLNEGKGLSLPNEPSADVAVRYLYQEPPIYRSIAAEEIADSKVEWKREEKRKWDNGLSMPLPVGAGHHLRSEWEVHWFGKDKPLLLNGNGGAWQGKASWRANEGLDQAGAVFGKLKVTIPTAIRTLVFAKQKDEEWLKQAQDKGGEIELRFNLNLVEYVAGPHQVLDFRLYDKDGRELKANSGPSSKPGGQARLCWGQPTRARIVISQEAIAKVFSFEQALPTADAGAFAKYKQQIADQKKVFDALKQISNSSRQVNGYGDDLAGLYYLYSLRGREEDRKPLKLILIEVAHACPEGAERFGYEAKPYAGYLFSVVQHKIQQGEKKPYRRAPKEVEFQWENGKFKALPFWEPVGIVAYPQDPSSPTFILSWGIVYMKEIGGKKPEAFPENVWKEKWAQVNFLKE